MAQGSQGFMWNLFPGAPHTCWKCGRENLRVKDVGEHRRKYPGGKNEFLCVNCQRKRINDATAATRQRFGLRS